MLEKYLRATEPAWRKMDILDVWEVDREEAVSALRRGGVV